MAVVIYYRRSDLLSVAFLVWKGPLGFYTEQTDAEGLGRKLLLTASGNPRRAPERRPWVQRQHLTKNANLVIFFFPYNPHPPPPRQTPPAVPPERARFRSVSAPFGSVSAPFRLRLALFRLRFGSVSGPFRGVGWGRGGVGERGFCKGKEYHKMLTLQALSSSLNAGTAKRGDGPADGQPASVT